MAETFMKSIVVFLIVLCSAPAFAQQCGKGQMPTPNGCIQICPPGYTIGKANGFDTCLREGNAQIGAHHRKYAFLPIAAGKDVDGICFGIREDESVETVVDDRFVEAEWHVQKGHAYVAEISYTLDPGLTKLPGDLIAANAEVPLYDAPQPKWPCTQQQWAAIMTPPQVYSVPPPGARPSAQPSGTFTPAPYVVPQTPMCQNLPIYSRYGSGCSW
jgi:hypothetical protein